MNKYLLDTNIFLQSYREYYCMDICPGFWDFLKQGNPNVKSIQQVYEELEPNKDNNDLMEAIKHMKEQKFFISEDGITEASFKKVSEVIENYKKELNKKFPSDNAKANLQTLIDKFTNSADYFLLSRAYQDNYIIVTKEKQIEDNNKIKIPNIAKRLDIKCSTLEEMLRYMKIKFII